MCSTDHIKSPAALIRHLHSCVFLDGEMDLQGPLEEEVEVGEQEEREEVKDKHTVGDTDRPPEGVEMDFGVPQECYCGLKDLPRRVSALERSLYLSLPSWVHAGVCSTLSLLCASLGTCRCVPAWLHAGVCQPGYMQVCPSLGPCRCVCYPLMFVAHWATIHHLCPHFSACQVSPEM